jgi:hypothetical protein
LASIKPVRLLRRLSSLKSLKRSNICQYWLRSSNQLQINIKITKELNSF